MLAYILGVKMSSYKNDAMGWEMVWMNTEGYDRNNDIIKRALQQDGRIPTSVYNQEMINQRKE